MLLSCDQIMYLCREKQPEKLSKSPWKGHRAEIHCNIRTYMSLIASAISISYKSNKNVIIFLTSASVQHVSKEAVGFYFISNEALKNY